MTMTFKAGEPRPRSLISETEELFQDAAEEVAAVIRKLKAGELDAKGAALSVRDARSLLQVVLEERAKIARFDKKEAGVAYDYALDFDAARAEIGRRLACLRDAGSG